MAALVIVAHSWWLTGLGPGPAIGGGQLGSWSVVGFFAISGYLITLSRIRARNGAAFFRGRFFRIMPGLAVCLIVTAFVFAPLATLFNNRKYSVGDAADFVLRNISIVGTQLGRTPIGSTLSDVPGADEWNSPLWTLFWEVTCYLLVGVLAYLKPELFRAAMVVVFAVVTGALLLQVAAYGPTAGSWGTVLCPVGTFVAGSLLCLFRTSIFLRASAVACALSLLAVSFLAGNMLAFCPLPIAYIILGLGSSPVLHRIGARFDVSYGMYIYGWPVQQILVIGGVGAATPLAVFAVLSLAVTVPLAWLSCVFIESPAQGFGRRVGSKDRFNVQLRTS
ncbi:peptidoglycan/LPS O-acetylase OafA/YrhL [Arthrobacter sp. SLBN-112]|nr:peptidoglycan/LPS O-acetylase OafA/YrhL [Arthrobacter sp. SLBN-112]